MRPETNDETTFTEVIETYSDLADPSQADDITYKAIDPKSVKVSLPASRNTRAQDITIDFNPINK